MTDSGDTRADVVRVDDVPVRLFLESQDHQHDLVREFQLVEIGDRYDLVATEVPGELARLVSDILSRYSAVRSATRSQAVAALRRGQDTTSLDVPVRPGMADAMREWLRLLEAADRICDRGQLLVPASRPEVRELRRWYVQEVTRQLDSRHRPDTRLDP